MLKRIERRVRGLGSRVGRSWLAATEPAPARALGWIRANHLHGGGIRVQSGHPHAYPEVTGYVIPTLLAYGDVDLAHELGEWLLCIQRGDGSFADPDQGRSFVFDTGQALRGLLAMSDRLPGASDAAIRAADYLV